MTTEKQLSPRPFYKPEKTIKTVVISGKSYKQVYTAPGMFIFPEIIKDKNQKGEREYNLGLRGYTLFGPKI